MKDDTFKKLFTFKKKDSQKGMDTFELKDVSQEIFHSESWDIPEFTEMVTEIERAMKYSRLIQPKKVKSTIDFIHID